MDSGDCVRIHPNAFQTLPLPQPKRPQLPVWNSSYPRPVGMPGLIAGVSLNYQKATTTIPTKQDPVIDLTTSRSPTPDTSKEALSGVETGGNLSAPPELRTLVGPVLSTQLEHSKSLSGQSSPKDPSVSQKEDRQNLSVQRLLVE
jgi:hypothetical protein